MSNFLLRSYAIHLYIMNLVLSNESVKNRSRMFKVTQIHICSINQTYNNKFQLFKEVYSLTSFHFVYRRCYIEKLIR